MSAVVIEQGIVHYEVFGRGRPLVFLHGWLGSWRYWMAAMEELSDHYRAYALDLWGFGDSDKTQYRYTVEDYTTLLGAFMDTLGIMRAPLVGHALGAAVALNFALREPQRVERIMAVCLPLNRDSFNYRLIIEKGSVLQKMRGWKPSGGHPEVESELPRTKKEAVTQSVYSVLDLDLLPILNKVQVPLLLVYGGRDAIVTPPQGQMQILQANNTRIRPITLPASRHFPMLDEASKFNRLLRDFLEVGDDLSQLEVKEEWRRRTH